MFIGAGFGAAFSEMPSFRLFVNNYASYRTEISPFFSSPFFNFFFAYRMRSGNFINAELNSIFFSKEINSPALYDISFQISKISVGLLADLNSGYGYYLLGGGAFSFNFSSLELKYNPLRLMREYYSTGWGVSLKAIFLAMLSDNAYVSINSSLSFDFNGEVADDDGRKLRNTIDKENVNLNSLNFQTSLGIAFKIN